MYSNMVCDYCLFKDNKYRVLTFGGDKIPCNKETASPTAHLLGTKILLNSTIYYAHKGAIYGNQLQEFLPHDIDTYQEARIYAHSQKKFQKSSLRYTSYKTT